MARGGFRPGAGRPKRKAAATTWTPKSARPSEQFTSALAFAMAVINDPDAPLEAKARLAIAAMPFQHAKIEAAPAPSKRERLVEAARDAAVGTPWEALLEVSPPKGETADKRTDTPNLDATTRSAQGLNRTAGN
jgi:hypothetical protein